MIKFYWWDSLRNKGNRQDQGLCALGMTAQTKRVHGRCSALSQADVPPLNSSIVGSEEMPAPNPEHNTMEGSVFCFCHDPSWRNIRTPISLSPVLLFFGSFFQCCCFFPPHLSFKAMQELLGNYHHHHHQKITRRCCTTHTTSPQAQYRFFYAL